MKVKWSHALQYSIPTFVLYVWNDPYLCATSSWHDSLMCVQRKIQFCKKKKQNISNTHFFSCMCVSWLTHVCNKFVTYSLMCVQHKTGFWKNKKSRPQICLYLAVLWVLVSFFEFFFKSSRLHELVRKGGAVTLAKEREVTHCNTKLWNSQYHELCHTCGCRDSLPRKAKSHTAIQHCNTLYFTSSVTLGVAVTHCNTLQHTATHCNKLQHTATHYISRALSHLGSLWLFATARYCSETTPMSHTATQKCNTLNITNSATHCNTLQHTAAHCNTLQHTATHCSTLQHTTTHCNTPQHTATHCNTLQHTATHCNTLQEVQHTKYHQLCHIGVAVTLCHGKRSHTLQYSTATHRISRTLSHWLHELYHTGVAVTLTKESEVTGGVKGLVLQCAFTSIIWMSRTPSFQFHELHYARVDVTLAKERVKSQGGVKGLVLQSVLPQIIWVMSHIWTSHVTHVNESCHTHERVMSQKWTSHVPHIWMSHIAQGLPWLLPRKVKSRGGLRDWCSNPRLPRTRPLLQWVSLCMVGLFLLLG